MSLDIPDYNKNKKLPPQTSLKNKQDRNGKDSEFSWGFCVVICLTLGLASFLMFSAWGRFSGTAWGSVKRGAENIEVVNEGFITVEVTDTKREAMLAQATQKELEKTADLNLKNLKAEVKKPEIKAEVKKAEVKKADVKDVKAEVKNENKTAEAKKDVKINVQVTHAAAEVKKAETKTPATINNSNNNKNSAFPLYASVIPDMSNIDALRDVEDFGPLPKFASEYESIILNVNEDGTKMPDPEPEELEELAELETLKTTTADKDEKADKAENLNKNKSEKAENSERELKDDKALKADANANANDEIKLEETGAAWKEHIVKSGETLSDIALAHGGVTAQDILRANGLKDANRLSANQILLIPNSPSQVEDTYDEVKTRQMRILAAREKPKPLKIASYVVAPGDSLWSISNSQGIELDTLIGSNAFTSSAKLRPGAALRIPNQDGIFYQFAKGDKIEKVCKLYGVDVNKLKAVNPTVDVVSLKAGDEIFLPGAKLHAVKVASARENNSKENDGSSKPARVTVIKSTQASAGRTYKWPVMGRINSPFGWRQHPITKRSNFHTGIDIKADRGTVIRSAGSGKVVYSGWMGGYGKVIVLEHNNGQSTLYAHCSSLLVHQGESVSQSENIARVGTTGQSTGPHLHFEVRVSNSPVNPLKYLK